MNDEIKVRMSRLKALCDLAGIDLPKFLGEVEIALENKVRALLKPNEIWFRQGKTLDGYWVYLEKATSHPWEYKDVDKWYKLLRAPSETREDIPPALRYQVLLRDKSTCQKCGRKAPNVELEVDHKLPWAWGGPTTIENLHTLCMECNRGKSNLYLDGGS